MKNQFTLHHHQKIGQNLENTPANKAITLQLSKGDLYQSKSYEEVQ